jgi:2-iminobutanoate/2-iminopropanoate deaminase
MKYCFLVAFVSAALLFADESWAQQLEYIGKPVRGIPVSSAVKVGKFVFVSGTPGYDKGKLAVGDFTAQMKQVMENISSTLKASGTGMERVVKINVLLMRAADFDEMNRIYSSYFPEGKYPARTTVVVAGLPHPDFLLEIECEAVLE